MRYGIASNVWLIFCFALFTVNVTKASEYWENAVVLIESGEYARAVTELDALLTERPHDSFLLRLKGFSLIALDRDPEAIPVLVEAVEADPEDISARYYLGQAYAYSGYIGHAIDQLAHVSAKAPGTPYAEASDELLAQLYPLAERSGQGYSESPWELTLQLTGKYDDNVPARANTSTDESPTDSFVYAVSAYGKYEFLRRDEAALPFRLGAEISGYQNAHGRRAFEGFDLTSATAKLFGYVRGDIAEQPLSWSNDVGLTSAWLDGEDYSTEYFVESTLDLQLGDHFMSNLGYRFTDLDFEDDTDEPEFFSRDGEEHVGTIGFNIYMLDNRLVLGASYSYTQNNTEGTQFDIKSNGVDAFVYVNLPGKVNLTLSGSYAEEDYEKFIPEPTRLDDVYTLGISLSRKFGKVEVSLSYTAIEADSNRDFAEYERAITDLMIRYAF